MNLFSCCRYDKQQSFKESLGHTTRAYSKHGKTFSLFLRNMSQRTPSTKQKLIEEEVMKLGNAKVSGQVFTYPELLAATDNFNDDCLLGEGGFGRVYKGYIKSIDQIVAIKQLDREGRQGNREFFSEVLMLNLVEHPNLVKLIGYCVDGDQSILVYEYMPNGSVENHLFDLSAGQEALDWNTRMRIALGAAKGLQYLHDIANPPVIYRDFKASNILLDAESNPKLSDFGLAKLGPSPTGDKQHVSTRVMGTFGYCAPEYLMTGKLTTKSDVYSFGVVCLELIAGRRVIDTARPTEEQNLIYWAEPFFKDERKFTAMADPMLEGNYPVKGLYQALTVAAMCLQEEAVTRPSMSDVVSALEFLATTKTGEQTSAVASKSSFRHVDSVKREDMLEER